MKREELFREIGSIDDQLIEAAGNCETVKGKRGISKKWIAALVACLVLYSSTSTVLLATEYYKHQSQELYIRYLTAEDMKLEPAEEYDAEKFLRALKSDNEEHVYIAINRLVECFNDPKLRIKALNELKPFVANDNKKIADAAAFGSMFFRKIIKTPIYINWQTAV